MSIYSSFKPTYLYIKQHSVTGKLYFGKTTRDPETYKGSGKHWLRHIKKHGTGHVITVWYCLFLDQESCTGFALNFSKQHRIVESSEWLNLCEENGLDGGVPGFSSPNRKPFTYKMSDEVKAKIGSANSKYIRTDDHKRKISESMTGLKWFNNGIEQIRPDVNDTIPDGFTEGRLYKSFKPCIVKGIEFESKKAAAMHFGVSPALITRWTKVESHI